MKRLVRKAIRRGRRARLRRSRRRTDLLTRLTDPADIRTVLEAGGAHIGQGGVLNGPLTILNGRDSFANLHVGANVHLGWGVVLDLTAPLTIKDAATISVGTTLLTHSDVGDRPLAERMPRREAATTVGEGSYLGANTTVLAGCHIGKEAVVGAGAVVTRPVPDEATVAGVPATRIDSAPPG